MYGAGAIGSVVGGHLFRTGHNVVLVGSSHHVDRICQTGLKLVTPEETYVLKIPAYTKAEELTPFQDNDVLLLSAKSQHTPICLGQLKNSGAPRTLPIFCLQNSIYNEAFATRIFDHIYGVMVNVSGIFLQPGEVINPVSGNRGFLEVGLYPRGLDDLAREVDGAFKKAGFVGGVNEWVMKAKGAKCLGNLGNALSAITNGKGDGSTFITETRNEAMTVWRVAGIEWEEREAFEKRVRATRGVNVMPRGYEDIRNRGSSWQSLMRSTGNIEAEQLNGDVVMLGRFLGIKTPYNNVLWRVAEEMATKREPPGKFTVEELTKMVDAETVKG